MASRSHRAGLGQTAICCLTFAGLAYLLGGIGYHLFAALSIALAGLFAALFVLALIRQWMIRHDLRDMLEPTGLYGQGIVAGETELKGYGLTKPLDGYRIFLGMIGQSVVSYDGKSHLLTIAPNAGGKSFSNVITNALHLKKNLIVTDKSGEVARRCFHHRRDVLGHHTICINPWGLGADVGLPNDEYNPAGILTHLASQNDPTLIDEIRDHMLQLIPETKGDNSYFPSAARILATDLMCFFAYWESDTGELVCNYPNLHAVFSGSVERLRATLTQMARSDYCDGTIAEAARGHLKRLDDNAKTFQSVLSEGINHLAIFDRRGTLARSCELSSFDPHDVATRKMSVFISAPADMITGAYGPWMGLVVHTLLRIGMRHGHAKYPTLILLDEFANLSKGALPSILTALYVIRGNSWQIWPFIQNKDSLAAYAPQQSAFESQSEVITCFGIRTPEDAEWVEKKSGQYSALTESPSLPTSKDGLAADGNYSIGLSEKAVPVIRKDQAMQLPDFTQIMFYKNKPVSVIDLVSFRAVLPWKNQAAALPSDVDEPDIAIRLDLTSNAETERRPVWGASVIAFQKATRRIFVHLKQFLSRKNS